ncbi:hypothetical protein [Methanotorris igneus]|uniref:Uncharacterized protein n=1 Tax=Methanotorris igneus (strain DSM 5666 / JCM 11834 / Kol 5) TaxID=880724 RepID=F6BBE2_METIK|nr:hypothetical protein [Methanotorris igneus]AEF97149.1 hypothetical protein Metig_1616 [Methanotorris igneus Kol 5]
MNGDSILNIVGNFHGYVPLGDIVFYLQPFKKVASKWDALLTSFAMPLKNGYIGEIKWMKILY